MLNFTLSSFPLLSSSTRLAGTTIIKMCATPKTQRTPVQKETNTASVKNTGSILKQAANGDAEVVRNFAFGSNMSYEKLCKRLRLLGLDTLPPVGHRAVLKDYKLSMDLAFAPPTEPAFASLIKSKGNCIYGLVYTLSPEQYKCLYMSEGGPRGAYTEEVVYPEILNDDDKPSEKVRAIAFKTKRYWIAPLEYAMRPSERYKNMLVSGAREANLPEHYIKGLNRIKAARPAGFGMRLFVRLQLIPIFAFRKTPLKPAIVMLGATRPLVSLLYGLSEYFHDSSPLPAAKVFELVALGALILITLPLSLLGACIAVFRGNLLEVIKAVRAPPVHEELILKQDRPKLQRY